MEVNNNLQASVAAAVPENVIEILQMCMFDEKVTGDISFFGTITPLQTSYFRFKYWTIKKEVEECPRWHLFDSGCHALCLSRFEVQSKSQGGNSVRVIETKVTTSYTGAKRLG